MVIFHSYVSLSEGNLYLVIYTWWRTTHGSWLWVSELPSFLSGLTRSKNPIYNCGYNPLTSRGMSHQVASYFTKISHDITMFFSHDIARVSLMISPMLCGKPRQRASWRRPGRLLVRAPGGREITIFWVGKLTTFSWENYSYEINEVSTWLPSGKLSHRNGKIHHF